MMREFRQSSSTPVVGMVVTLVVVVTVGCLLRFFALDAKTLWLDEAFSLWMAQHSLAELIAWLVRIDHHPPLYYFALHHWIQWFGDGPSALRSLSALAASLALPCYAMGAWRLAGPRVGVVATLLLALAPFHVRYAQETRMYGVLTLVVALMFLALATLLTSPRATRQWRWWVLLVVSEAAAMLTHNTATVLIPLALNGAVLVSWWLTRYGEAARAFTGMAETRFLVRWGWSQVAVLMLWSPWSIAFVRQVQVVDGDFWIAPPDLWTVWLALNALTVAHLPEWLPLRDYVAWVTLALVVVGVWHWRRQRALTILLLTMWLIPPVVELIASLRRPIFYDRTLIWTTLPYFLLIARGVVWPESRDGIGRIWMGATLAVLVVLSMLGLRSYYRNFAKEAWDEVAAVVAMRALSNELVLFHASWAELPFDYYYPGDAPVLERRGVPADLFDAGVLEPPMTSADVPRVEALITRRERVWLVYSHWWYTDPEGLLLQVLDAQMDVVQDEEWPGIRVVEYMRKP